MVLLTYWTICPKISTEVMHLNKNLDDLYCFPESLSEIDIYIEDLAVQCRQLEDQINAALENLPADFRELLLSYLDLRDDLDVYTVRKAIRYGNSQKIYTLDNGKE